MTDTIQNSALGISKVVEGAFGDVIDRVTAALKTQGFGVLSDIDVSATLKEKIGAEIEPYRILGACNPGLAHRALTADREIGLLLPCNVVVREQSPGRVLVQIADPETVFSVAPSDTQEQASDLPGEARAKLEEALKALT